MIRSRRPYGQALATLAASCAGLGAIPASAQPLPSSPAPQTPVLKSMTLSEAIAQARANQPAVRAALASVRAQEKVAKVPRAQWLPTLGVTAQFFGATANNTTGTYVTPSFMDIPRIGGTRVVSAGTLAPYASTFAGVGVTQEMFDFGRIAAQAAVEDARVDVEKARANGELLGVTFDVEEAYFAVFAAKQVVKASDDAYERSRVHRDLAKAGVNSGLRPPIELTRAEADLTRFDIGRIRAQGSLAIAEQVLGAAVGTPDVSIDVPLAPPAPAELPDLTVAIRQAAARDPRVLEALAQLRASERRTRAIVAELRPDIAVTGAFSTRAGGAPPSGNGEGESAGGFLPDVANWDVGVVLSWPLFDGTVKARAEAAGATEQVRREEIALAHQEEVATIRQAYESVGVARATLPGLERAIEAAWANYAQADARFRAGLGTSIELADAEALRTDAEIQMALGLFELARARAAFGRAIAEGT